MSIKNSDISSPDVQTPPSQLFIGNLPFNIDETKLRELFQNTEITNVKLIKDRETGSYSYILILFIYN